MALNPGQQANARFYELLWPFRADVLRRAREICGNAADAEELAQETLLRAFAAGEGLEKGDDVRVWLMQILLNARAERMGDSKAALIEAANSANPVDLIDTSRLDAMLEMQIPRPASGRMEGFFRSPAVRAVAVFIAIMGIAGLIVRNLSGGAVLASPEVMAQFHEELVSGKAAAIPVDSISAANQALADEMKTQVQIPQIPADRVTMCCMRSIKDKRVACVLLYSDGVPVTMVVANAMDMRTPDLERRIEKRAEYHVTKSGKLHLVMTERRGRWICLISELPLDRLVEVAGTIEL